MTRRLRLYSVVAVMLALLFGVGLTSAAFACEAEQAISSQCANSECDAQSADRGCALACAPIAPAVVPAIEPAVSLFHRAPAPSAALQSGLASRPIGPEPPPPRNA